jgi:phosphoglycerate dehydrogenase-like enzyme
VTVRVGVDESVDSQFLNGFSDQVRIVRIPETPAQNFEIDFWVAAMPPRILRKQWPYLKGVKVIQAPWAGVDTLLHLFPPEVTLCDAKGVHDIPTAEWTITAILAVQKCLPFFMGMQIQGRWAQGQQANQSDAIVPTKIKNPPAPVRDLSGSVVLIIGYGAIGRAIETRLKPFGVTVLRIARHQREGVHDIGKLDDFLGQADIVVLTAPLTSETKGMIDAKRLAKLKTGALLVNASRGQLVDTNALLHALCEHRLRAALDVTDPEPLPADHPLWKAPNLLITPHIAGDSDRFMTRAFKLVREQVDRFTRGEELLNIVSGEY